MKVLLFNPDYSAVTQKIREAVSTFDHCSVVESAEHTAFQEAFLSCLSGETIVVFFVKDEKDMVFLESVQKEFVDIKLLINVPDSETELRTRALKLNPRMLTTTQECCRLLPGSVHGIVKKELKNRNADTK